MNKVIAYILYTEVNMFLETCKAQGIKIEPLISKPQKHGHAKIGLSNITSDLLTHLKEDFTNGLFE